MSARPDGPDATPPRPDPGASGQGEEHASGALASEAHGSAVIPNPEGMHARPCHALVSLARQHACELRVTCQGREVSGHSILELMTLAAASGAELTFKARGPDARELVERLVAFVRSGFGSPA